MHVYITILEHTKISDKTLPAKRIQTISDFPFHKNENQLGLCKVRMRTADADGGRRMADGGRTKKEKKIIEKKMI